VISSKAFKYRVHNTESKEYYVQVQYEYEIQKEYLSKTSSLEQSFKDLPLAQVYIDQHYPVGKEIPVYYKFENSKFAVLDTRAFDKINSFTQRMLVVTFMMGVLCVAVGMWNFLRFK
jgi:hypothetical protein